MNLDQLIKLVKLANNNPNDHEANAAARKVCKMIAANNYKLNSTKEPVSVTGGTWNDIKCSTEPMWRYKFWENFARKSRSYESRDWTRNEPPRNKTVYEQRLRDCSICDKTKLTADNNNPFVCADCKWRKYEEEKKK